MKKLFSIYGPTAVGKTSFTLQLAQKALGLVDSQTGKKKYTGVDIISADSRQVYRGLEVLTGADVPEGFEQIRIEKKSADNFPYFEKDNVRLHGVSIINPTDEWSVAHFKNFAIKIIKQAFENNRLPIIVGGTSLYINHLFNRDENLYVRPVEEVRAKAESKSVEELQEWLKSVNPEKISQMNNSDINNPRRLVRAIEISLGEPDSEEVLNLPTEINHTKIALRHSSDPEENLEWISEKIYKRVEERLENGAVDEVKKLSSICDSGPAKANSWDEPQVCSTLGVRDIQEFVDGKIDQQHCIEAWALHELQYAKRQIVWLKKEQDLVWLDDSSKSSYTFT